MTDVRLLYPKDKCEPALRLSEALEAAGYEVEREALAGSGAFPDLAAEAGKAKALILIWSRGLVAADMAGSGLASARRNPNLIEVSADGIEPAAAEASPVVLLCGWRGQPYHQGWQRILAEVKRLCGPKDASARSPRPAPAGDPRPSAARPSAFRRAPVRAAVAAGALVAAALGAGALYERGAADRGAQAPPVAAADVARPAGTATAPSPPAAVATLVPAEPDPGLPADRPASETPATAEPARAATAERRAPVRPAATRQRAGPERLAASSGREVKRYSRKYSKTMRLFCQRSGRSTPQCRTFARSMRELDG